MSVNFKRTSSGYPQFLKKNLGYHAILGPGQYNKWMMVLQDPDNVNSKQSNGNA